jgi:two-component system response regulator RegX3
VEGALRREGFKVIVAADGDRGIDEFRTRKPALVLIDLMLPTLSGLDVCRQLRAESTVPMIILSAKDSESDKVAGLEVGADDFISKPFSLRELVARVRSQLRRAKMVTPLVAVDVLSGGPVRLDVGHHEVRVRGKKISLPRKEFELLQTFLLGKGRLRTRDFLISHVWGPDYVGDGKTLDVHVRRLRHKIERDPHHPEHLVTVRGLGYRFINNGDRIEA